MATWLTSLFSCLLFSIAFAQDFNYYGNNIDSISYDVIQIDSLKLMGLSIGSKEDKKVTLKSMKINEGIDELTGEQFKIYFYDKNMTNYTSFILNPESNKYLLKEFSLYKDSSLSLEINSRTIRLGSNIEMFKSTFKKSYDSYTDNLKGEDFFKLIVFKDNKRIGLDIVFKTENDVIVGVFSRYDE